MTRSIPFPIASGRYETGPGMRRFGQAGGGFPAESGHFHVDEDRAATLAAKLAVLRRASGEAHLLAPDADQPAVLAALREAFALLAAEHPAIAAVDGSGVTLHELGLRLTDGGALVVGDPVDAVAAGVRRWLLTRTGLALWGDALALSVQEDLALVRGPEEDTLEWLHVCLPSNWVPAEKIGRSFASVHEPVAHNQQLMAGRAQIIRAMINAGPFVRYVWGIHRDGEYCHNPRLHQAPPWPAGAAPEALARMAWLRVERQTTHGFPALGRALFTIRYYLAPLAEVADDPWRRERLAAALAGMDTESLGYKGLAPARDGLVAWLSAHE